MRFAILGNSGSGKSTLAAWLAQAAGLAVLDLDSVAWEPGAAATPRAESAARAEVSGFCGQGAQWVVEGCYTNLVEMALQYQPRLIFLNPGLEQCLANCRQRPWEPHKYRSRQEQDDNLNFLLSWVTDYYNRDGPMSLRAHLQCYAAYDGPKVELGQLPDLYSPAPEVLAWLR